MTNITSLRHWFKSLLPRRKKNIAFAGGLLRLDVRWRHERKYLDYVEKGLVNGPIAMDAWVLGTFVKPGDVVLDAGANIGFTALLAKKAGAAEIHCFEPDPRLIDRLRTHCQDAAFRIYELALGERRETLSLRLSATHNQGSTLSDTIIDRYPKLFRGAASASVQVETIDSLFPGKKFDLMKIDVEGAELATLRGAARLLEAHAPGVIYIEIYPEFLGEVHTLLELRYPFCYRVACDHRGGGRLLPWEFDVGQLDSEQFFTIPPSYVFSTRNLDEHV